MHTFDIRFARSEGLAGLFEAPANQLGWKGSGRLSIDAQGISIAVKRGLLSLFSRRTRRFSADSLTEAYREGDALRLVFGNRDRHEILAVWARGGEAAAQIVKLLPTLRTVELDHPTDAAKRYRFDWRVLAIAAAIVIGAGIWLYSLSGGSSTDSLPAEASVSRAAREQTAVPADNINPEVGKGDSIQPSVLGSGPGAIPSASVPPDDVSTYADASSPPAYDDPSAAYGSESSATPAASQSTRSSASPPAEAGAATYARDPGISMIELFDIQSSRGIDDMGWWQFTVRLHTTPEFQRPDLWALREAMLAISRAWRAHDIDLAKKLTREIGYSPAGSR